jgi:hypothetical protein
MLTIVRVWIAASLVLGVALAIDQLRRPAAAWEAAGRERRFWVAVTIASGFHGLGPLSAVAYFTAVVPRLRAADPAGPRPSNTQTSLAIPGPAPTGVRALEPLRGKVALWRGQRTATEALALVAGLLVFASSVIHAAVVNDHVEYYWPSGAFFLVVACAQAAWAVLAYRAPSNRRILLAGAIGNGALAVLWAISRTVGMPVGPQPWSPEPIGAADVLSTIDELAAVVLLGMALAVAPGVRIALKRIHIRLATSLAGPLFIYSMLAATGAKHHH